jgi:hypothetical protein
MEQIILKQESKFNYYSENKRTFLFLIIRYYLRARLLYPKNGKSCKQLAILAVMTVRTEKKKEFYF